MTSGAQLVEAISPTGTIVLRIQGRLDADSAPKLIARCTELQNAGLSLVLNLASVTFLSSSGAGALLMLTEQFHERGSDLRLAALSGAVRSVIELLELGSSLAIDQTERDSVAALEARK
jgi:anti-anti-sigma factor